MTRSSRTSGTGRIGGAASIETVPPTLALWGNAGSGKSGVIGALRSESAKTVGERWAADLEEAHSAVVELADSASLALRLRDVKVTPIHRPDRAVTLLAKRYAGARTTDAIEIAVLDPRGVVAEHASAPEARDVMRALATADGILWLMDAKPVSDAQRAHDRDVLLRQIVAMLAAARGEQVRIPVAVAISKIDRLPAAVMRSTLDAPEEMVRSHLGDAAFGWLLAACPHLRCFAFSSSGTVRNAARPIGLGRIFDWFAAEWRRGAREEVVVRARARRSERIARMRRRVPFAALVAGAVAVAVFAGVAGARRLAQRPSRATWTISTGGVDANADSALGPTSSRVTQALTALPRPSLTDALAASDRGDAPAALALLARLDLPAADTTRAIADSLLAITALEVTEGALRAPAGEEAFRLVVRATSAAIARAYPGTYILAPLSLARAEACIGGRLGCGGEQLREDLAWVLLLGTPVQQDEARSLRAAWLADTTGGS